MSWMEFASTSRKISRYNASVVAIEDLILWWDSLGLVEKVSPVNVKALTHGGESALLTSLINALLTALLTSRLSLSCRCALLTALINSLLTVLLNALLTALFTSRLSLRCQPQASY
jgi:hypothetical protein